jgi:hypothetical protein
MHKTWLIMGKIAIIMQEQCQTSWAHHHQQYNQHSLEPDRILKLEDIVIQFMQVFIFNQKRIDASTHNIEF